MTANDRARSIIPAAFLVAGALMLVVAIAPDAAFATVLTGILRRAKNSETLADWHRLQHSALLAGVLAIALGAASIALWRRIEPALERLGSALHHPDRSWAFDFVAVLIVLGAVHGTSLLHSELRGDDYLFLRWAQLPLSDTILRTWGGHVFPLWRVEGALLHNLWGPHSWVFRWWLFANVALLALLQARILAAWGLSRGARLVGVVILCGWTQWAQVTMGYWTLSITVKVWIVTSIAVLAIIGDERPGTMRKAILAVAALAAILEDSTGAIVVPALVIAAITSGVRSGFRGRELIRRSAWPAAIATVCAVTFFLGQWLVHVEAEDLLAAAGGGSVINEATYLLGFGIVGPLFAPIIVTLLPSWLLDGLSLPLAAFVVGVLWLVWRRGSLEERALWAYNVGLLCCGLLMVVVARPYATYYWMVSWTHYIAYLYIPIAAVIALGWQEVQRIRRWRPALEVQYLAIACVAFIGLQETSNFAAGKKWLPGGRTWEIDAARRRAEMITVMRDSIFLPLTRTVGAHGVIPEMLGPQLDARFPRLHPLLPLSFYEAAAGIPRGRFHWVVGPYVDGRVSEVDDATPVTRMKGVIDPGFRSAMHEPGWWRDSYFASAPIETISTLPIACDATRRGADPLVGDADHRHWLLLYVGANGTSELPTLVDVAFKTEFRARAVYQFQIVPATSGCFRVELLNLPEFALSQTVELVGLEHASSRRIELVGLFPPAVRRR